jgi:50S ribosomal protein L16 3-hydroxylase
MPNTVNNSSFPTLRFPSGLDAEGFLARYWQRRPLLMRQALPGFENPLPADELAGLACEPDVEARILLERSEQGPWQLLHGPFDAEHFAALPETHWTLLVQDVDKHIPEIGALLERFRFLPKWRLDDIMISYAEDQGSVGPHVDDYDVFLIQAEGRRRWRISTRADAPLELLPDLEIKILERFEPDQDWLLEPGDILYLPPGVPHWGVAEGACQTWSVGLRAPSWGELADDWLAEVAERFTPAGRWRDPSPDGGSVAVTPDDPAELTAATIASMRTQIESGITAAGCDDFAVWLGKWMTEPKLNLELAPLEPSWPVTAVIALLESRGALQRDGRSLLLFARSSEPVGPVLLFANGEHHRLPAELAPFVSLLANGRELEAGRAQPWLDQEPAQALLATLFNAGHYRVPDESA